jgi:hypothetical protein
VLAEKTLEVDFSRVPCKQSRLDTRSAATVARGRLRPNPGSDVEARQPEYRADVLPGAGRAGFYRSLSEQMPVGEEMEVRPAIQRIAVEHGRRYGYPPLRYSFGGLGF